MDRLKRSGFAITSLLSGILAPGVLVLGSIVTNIATVEVEWSGFVSALVFVPSIILAIMALIFGGIALTQGKSTGKVMAIVGALLGIMHIMMLSLLIFL